MPKVKWGDWLNDPSTPPSSSSPRGNRYTFSQNVSISWLGRPTDGASNGWYKSRVKGSTPKGSRNLKWIHWDNLSNRGAINVISGGVTNRDSNRARKDYSQQLESHRVGSRQSYGEEPTLRFGPEDLEGVVTPHYDVLVLQTTITNCGCPRCSSTWRALSTSSLRMQ